MADGGWRMVDGGRWMWNASNPRRDKPEQKEEQRRTKDFSFRKLLPPTPISRYEQERQDGVWQIANRPIPRRAIQHSTLSRVQVHSANANANEVVSESDGGRTVSQSGVNVNVRNHVMHGKSAQGG